MERETLKLAQKAMLNSNSISYEMLDAITAIKEALAQPAQEPVAWRRSDKHRTAPNYEYEDGITSFRYDPSAEPLYTTPPNRPWAGLTDEEIKEIVGPYGDTPIKGYTRKLFDQIEAKLKDKNNG
jgi:hypothetical protein